MHSDLTWHTVHMYILEIGNRTWSRFGHWRLRISGFPFGGPGRRSGNGVAASNGAHWTTSPSPSPSPSPSSSPTLREHINVLIVVSTICIHYLWQWRIKLISSVVDTFCSVLARNNRVVVYATSGPTVADHSVVQWWQTTVPELVDLSFHQYTPCGWVSAFSGRGHREALGIMHLPKDSHYLHVHVVMAWPSYKCCVCYSLWSQSSLHLPKDSHYLHVHVVMARPSYKCCVCYNLWSQSSLHLPKTYMHVVMAWPSYKCCVCYNLWSQSSRADLNPRKTPTMITRDKSF